MATLTSHSRYTEPKTQILYRWGQSAQQQQPFPGAGRGCKYEQREEEAAEISAGEQRGLTLEASCWKWSFLQLRGSVVKGWRLSFPTRGAAAAQCPRVWGPRERASE